MCNKALSSLAERFVTQESLKIRSNERLNSLSLLGLAKSRWRLRRNVLPIHQS